MTQSPKGPKPKRSGKPRESLTDKAQSERFIEAARTLDLDDAGKKFSQVIEKILQSRSRRKQDLA